MAKLQFSEEEKQLLEETKRESRRLEANRKLLRKNFDSGTTEFIMESLEARANERESLK